MPHSFIHHEIVVVVVARAREQSTRFIAQRALAHLTLKLVHISLNSKSSNTHTHKSAAKDQKGEKLIKHLQAAAAAINLRVNGEAAAQEQTN